jgi:urease accessory protein
MTPASIRLFQLCSSALPVGGFTYSQGIEYAVECGWITSEADLKNWLTDLIETNLVRVDIPLLKRMYEACIEEDETTLNRWCQQLIAYRETAELRSEERNRGRAMASLLVDLEVTHAKDWRKTLDQSQLAGMALACHDWHIQLNDMVLGFAWSWLENMVISGVKLVPLGQVAGQRILHELAELLTDNVSKGLALDDSEIGSSSPALAYVSARHETQYTRLYRS